MTPPLELLAVDEDICGLCGQPGADKYAHPMHWPGDYVCNKCGAMFMSDMVFPGCPECGYQPRFVSVPIAELEELVKALEWSNQAMDAWNYDETLLDGAKETAAQFRAKYLEK